MKKRSKMTMSGGTLAAVTLFLLGQGPVVSAGGERSNSATAWVFETSTAVDVTQTAPASPHFRFTHLTVEDGLSDSAMSSVVQDQQGFMWFGTERGGLNRYDGYEFKVYQHDEDDEQSLSVNRVTALLLDSQGTLWVGTGAGLNRYNRDTDDFTCYRSSPGDDTSLTDMLVSALCEDASGAIWVGTDKGVCRLDRKTGKFMRYRHDPENPRSLSSDFIRSVFADPQSGKLWVGTVDQGAGVLDPASGEFTAYRYDPNIPGSIGGSDVTCFLRDKAGVLWVGTGGGLNRFVPETKTFVHYRHDPEDSSSISDDYVWALYEDRAGRFWVCTPRGLNLMDRSRGFFSRLLAAQGDPTSYCAASLNQVCEDNTGAIWATSHLHGVVRLPSVPEKFKVYCHNPENTNSLCHSMVQGIHIDRNNRAWIGTLAGLDYLDDCRPPVKRSILVDAHAVTEDKQGQIWAGAFPQGLFRIHGDNVTHYPHDPSNPNSPATDQIWALETDDLGGLWIIYWAAGIGRFDGQTFTHYTADPTDPQAVPASKSYGFAKDRDGFIWLAGEGGLTRFSPGDAVFKTYLIDPEHPENEVNRSLLSVYIDQDRPGEMWVGTLFGLFRFDPVSGRFTRCYTKKDGLPSDNVQSIQRDNQGRLWLGTTAGLSRFDPEQGIFRNYDKSDGLPGNKFFIGAAAKAPDGQMFFGSTEGLASFYPDKMRVNPNPPPVVLTDFQLFNKPVPIGETSPLPKAIDVADRITLRYDQDVFRLRFAALDYTAPENNRYAYKLEGFDKDWRYVGANDRSATYTRLSPGEYTFQVKASNNDGLWNEQGASIQIVVIPPWWQTWWFRSAAAGSLLALVYAGFGLRIRSMHKRNLQLERQIAERKRAEAALQKSETLLNAAQRLSKVGGWEYDVKSGTSFWTEELYRINEIPNDPGIDHIRESLACFRPEDRPMLSEAFQRACEQGEPYDFELPFTTYTGKPLWIRTTALPVVEDGKVVRLVGNLMDITARKQAQEATAQEQERLKFIFDSLPIGISLNRTYADGSEVRMINDAHLRIAGITREQDNPETWKRVNHPDNSDERDDFMFESDRGKIKHFVEDKRYIHPDGKIVWVAFSRLRRALADGGFEDLCTAVDITERKQAQERVAHLASIVEFSDDAIIGKTLDGTILSWNRGAERIYGYTAAEIVGHSISMLVPPEMTDELAEIIARLNHGEKVEHHQTTRVRKDGMLINVSLTISPIKDARGQIIGASAIARDITERVQAEDEIHRLADLQQAILSNAAYMVISTDAEGIITTFNPAAERYLGYTAEEFVGKQTPSVFYDPDEVVERARIFSDELGVTIEPGFEVFVAKARRNLPDEYEWTFVCKDGRRIPVLLSVTALRDPQGNIDGFLGMAIDISERKQAEVDRQTNLHFFESMNLINQAIQRASNLEQMMSDVLDTMLSIFGCDRAFLATPCDPTLPEFEISMERTTSQYPGAFARRATVPMTPAIRNIFQELLSNPVPNEIHIGKGLDPDDVVWKTYEIKSQLALAFHPKVGHPWECGLHQCSRNRTWTAEEKRLFQEIGRRLADGLSTMLVYRDLQESEAEYRRIVDTANEGIWSFGPDETASFINARMADMLGYSIAEMTGRSMTDFMLEEDVPDQLHRMENRRQGLQESYECRFRSNQGEIVWALVSATPVFDDLHRYQGSFAMLTDITERKRVEDALLFVAQRGWLADSGSFFDSLARFLGETLDIDYVVIDRIDAADPGIAESVALYAKGAIAPNLRYALKDTPCENVMGRQLCSYPQGVQQLFPGDPLLVEMNVESYVGIPLWDYSGRPIGLIALMACKPLVDTAPAAQVLQLVATCAAAELERERNDQLLRAREHEFRTMAENLPNNIIRYDRDGRCVYVNPEIKKNMGVADEQILGLTIRELHPDGSFDVYAQAVDAALANGVNSEIEMVLPVPSEKPIVHQIRTVAERDERGEVTGVLAIGFDITALRQAEEEIRKLNQDLEQRVVERTAQLEAANRELEAFSYSVSHDLRAPLRHIDGYVDLLISRCRSDLNEQGLHYLDTIAAAARRMGLLIDDLLQFSRTGRSEMRREKVDMNQTLQEVLSELKESYEGRSIEWIVEDLPSVTGDYSLLRQVWANLLENTIKYTRPRKTARIEIGAKEGGDEIVFSVADNGVGFDMRYCDKLFGVFQRLHFSEEFEGTGIGLATVQRIIARHGGRVWADAEVGKGATFYFSLPTMPN